jgi:parvulin-like peptidyl-prolyl isomerase
MLRPSPNLVTRQPSQADLQSMAWTAGNSNQIAANVDNSLITSFDVRKGVAPLLASLFREHQNNPRPIDRDRLVNEAVIATRQQLVERRLLLREFSERGGTLPFSYVASSIEERIQSQFNGDRSEYLSALKLMGTTPLEDRFEAEENIILQYMMSDISKATSRKISLSPRKITEFYEANKDKAFVRSEQIRFRQITLTPGAAETDDDVRKQAQNILAELANGTAFGDLARRYSKDDFRNDDGGGERWRDPASINEKIIAAIMELPNGGNTGVMDFTPPGGRATLYLFQRVEHRAGGPVPLPEVQDAIAEELIKQEQNTAQTENLERLRKKFFVRYY